MNLSDNYLGLAVQLDDAPNLKGYPAFYGSAFDMRCGSIGGADCLFISPNKKIDLATLKKVAFRLEEGMGRNSVIVSPDLSTYQLRRLIEHNIAWIRSDDVFFLPFLGLLVKRFSEPIERAENLTIGAQRVVYHIIDKSWDGKTTSEVADLLGKSLASASNYFTEITRIAPEVFATRGRARSISVAHTDKGELFSKFEPHLSSLVAERQFLKWRGSKHPEVMAKWSLAGVSALSQISMLADNPWRTYAVDMTFSNFMSTYHEELQIVQEGDEPDFLLECWPKSLETVDGRIADVPLYFSFKDDALDDSRLEQALDRLQERICS